MEKDPNSEKLPQKPIVSEEREKIWEDINALKKEVRSLKTRLGKLTTEVEHLEINGFQEQLERFNERVSSQEKSITSLKRNSFHHQFVLLARIAQDNIHEHGHSPIFPPMVKQSNELCSTEINGYYREVLERIKHCNETEEMEKVFKSFSDLVNDTLRRHGIPTINIIDK